MGECLGNSHWGCSAGSGCAHSGQRWPGGTRAVLAQILLAVGRAATFGFPPFAKVHTPAVAVMSLHVLGEYFVCSFGITGL